MKPTGLKNKILSMFKNSNEFTVFELKLILNLDENIIVSRRISELKNNGLIFENGKTITKNGKKFKVYQFTLEENIEKEKQNVYNQKKENWYKQGLKKGYFTEKKVLSYEL